MSIKHLPSYYSTQLHTLNKDFTVSLLELTNSFPYAKTYPKIPAMTDRFSKDQGSMNVVRGNFFIFKDTLSQDITTTANTMTRINLQIDKLERDNAKLMIEFRGMENRSEGAIGMYDDSRLLYNQKLLVNWLYIGTICSIGAGLYKITGT